MSLDGGGGVGLNAGVLCTVLRPGYGGGGGLSNDVDGFSVTADDAAGGDTLTVCDDLSYGATKLTDELMTFAGVVRHISVVAVIVAVTSRVVGVMVSLTVSHASRVSAGAVALCAVGQATSQLCTCCKTTAGCRLLRTVAIT